VPVTARRAALGEWPRRGTGLLCLAEGCSGDRRLPRRRGGGDGPAKQTNGGSALGLSAPSAVSTGCRQGAATGQQRECAVTPTVRTDLLRSGFRQRGSHCRQFPALRPALSLHDDFAGRSRAGREHAAGHVRHGRGARISGQGDELSGDAESLAAQPGVCHHRGTACGRGRHRQRPGVHCR
jgi:hypothetical protein